MTRAWYVPNGRYLSKKNVDFIQGGRLGTLPKIGRKNIPPPKNIVKELNRDIGHNWKKPRSSYKTPVVFYFKNQTSFFSQNNLKFYSL